MAAPTTNSSKTHTCVDRIIHEAEFSAITAAESFSYTFPSNLPALDPTFVRHAVVTQPTSRDVVDVHWTSDSTPGDTNSSRAVELTIMTSIGGSLTGAVVRVYFEWLEQGSGGLS